MFWRTYVWQPIGVCFVVFTWHTWHFGPHYTVHDGEGSRTFGIHYKGRSSIFGNICEMHTWNYRMNVTRGYVSKWWFSIWLPWWKTLQHEYFETCVLLSKTHNKRVWIVRGSDNNLKLVLDVIKLKEALGPRPRCKHNVNGDSASGDRTLGLQSRWPGDGTTTIGSTLIIGRRLYYIIV